MKKSLAVVFSLLLVATAAVATPPTPAARIQTVDDNRKEVALAKDAVPIRIVARDADITELTITATLTRLDPGKPDFAQSAPTRIYERKLDIARDKIIEVPIQGDVGKGEAKLEIRLKGRKKNGAGFSDRLVRYLRRGDDGRLLMITPQERQARRDTAKQRAFDDKQKEYPRSHPIDLLFGETVKVPADAKHAKEPFGPSGNRIEVRPAELTPYLKKHSVDKTATSYSSEDPITVRGRFMFTDIDGMWKPAVNVAIHLWDDDTFIDEHLGTVATGWDGRWSFTVNNDDGWFQDGRDIYYTAKLDTTRLSLGSCGFLSGAYEWRSATRDDLNDGTTVDFGEETGSTDTEALQVYSTLNLAWNHAVGAGGFDPGNIDGCFPGSGTFFNGSINIASDDTDGPDSITHEYGHGVMARAYSGGDPSPGGAHGFGDCNQNNALSWSEGFATGFMLTLRQDGAYNWHEGDGGQPIEGFNSTCHGGEGNEGWVAAALLDMFDNPNDSNGGNVDLGRHDASDSNAGSTVGLATILRDSMVGTQHNSVSPFWSDLAGNLTSAQRNPAQTAMNYDYMPVILPGSCVATKVATQTMRAPDSILGGLRKFRDHGLKTWPTGRALANIYYRNSPEIALILLQNPSAVSDVQAVMKYFATVGETISNHQRFQKMVAADPVIVPQDVAASANRVLDLLTAKGSASLKQDLKRVKSELASAQRMTFSQLEARAQKEKQELVEKGGKLEKLKTDDYSETSRGALKDKRLQDVIKRSMEKQ